MVTERHLSDLLIRIHQCPRDMSRGKVSAAHFRWPSNAFLSPTLVNSITHFPLPIPMPFPFRDADELVLLPLHVPIPKLSVLSALLALLALLALPTLTALPCLSLFQPSSLSPSLVISPTSITTTLDAFLPLSPSLNPLTTISTSCVFSFSQIWKKGHIFHSCAFIISP